MKKFLTLAVVAIATLTASAQVYLGGSLGVMRNDTKKTTDFTIAPEIGYNLGDNWAVGATISYTHGTGEFMGMDDVELNNFTIAPYARYKFFKAVDDRLALFIDGGFGIGFVKPKGGKNGSVYNIGFKPGISFALNDHFTILSHIGFLGYEGGKEGYAEKKFGLDFSSLNLNFGFYYTF